MLVNQRAECRFSIHFVVFFCLVCMLFRVFTGFIFFQYFIWFVMGTGVFQRELKFLHAMVLFRHLSIGERIVLS